MGSLMPEMQTFASEEGKFVEKGICAYSPSKLQVKLT